MRLEDWNVLKLVVFRENMNSSLSLPMAKQIFGEDTLGLLDDRVLSLLTKQGDLSVVEEKYNYLLQEIDRFLISDWVRYIAITGSVAAQTAKEEDDIDLFVVVKNGRGWLYRGLMLVRNLFTGKVRSADGRNVRDKFCVNMIVEERGLQFKPDIFNFHELYYMISAYNPSFWFSVISQNEWVKTFGGVFDGEELEVVDERVAWGMKFLNGLAMFTQILYMLLLFHKPNLRKIFNNYSDGKIMFHPKDFKEEKVSDYEQRYEERLKELMGED